MEDKALIMPAVALRGMAILPGMVAHFDISRSRSLKAVEHAMMGEQKLFLVAQRDIEQDSPKQEELFNVGIIADVRQVVKLQNDIVRILVEGIHRAKLLGFTDCGDFLEAQIAIIEEQTNEIDQQEYQAMVESVKDIFLKYTVVNGRIAKDILRQVSTMTDLAKLIDYVTNNLPIRYDSKQKLLEATDLKERYEVLITILYNEIEITELKNDFQKKVKERVDKHQKEYILREQMGLIREELGEDNMESDAASYLEAVENLQASETVKKRIRKEISRFKNIHGNSSESNVIRGYIETLLELPWDKKSEDNRDLNHAEKILNRDHYGLEKVKERVLEFLAVRNLTEKGDCPIICLVGPPGTGKTSIARSVAEALNKQYVRICLGGVRDEAEIRGHRKTYVGAMPGRIIAGLKTAGVSNPLMLLDEIDKVSSDYKGDTSAALLEVLDSEQNDKFRDHYIEMPVDLSEVLFIATANSVDTISKPLLDRMEVIEVNSYTENEKFHIAKDHLIAKQLGKHGLKSKQLSITDTALEKIIHSYTKEAGVRGLERKLGQICRKAAREIYQGEVASVKVKKTNLEKYLGKEKYMQDKKNTKDEIGIVRGLAWTSVGGVTLEIEVNVMPGKGELKLTGQMGDVMQESALTGLSYVRSISPSYGVEAEYFMNHDIHIHIPEGAVPKDGPSAGITMATAMLSAVIEKSVRADVAMTGEITLRGRVLPIGGLKEKLLAAKNADIHTVCIPKNNEKDLEEIADEILSDMEILPVERLDQVLKISMIM